MSVAAQSRAMPNLVSLIFFLGCIPQVVSAIVQVVAIAMRHHHGQRTRPNECLRNELMDVSHSQTTVATKANFEVAMLVRGTW